MTMSDAETAYKAAEAEIERVRANGGDILKLSGKDFTALTRLYLDGTQVSDLTPPNKDRA